MENTITIFSPVASNYFSIFLMDKFYYIIFFMRIKIGFTLSFYTIEIIIELREKSMGIWEVKNSSYLNCFKYIAKQIKVYILL